MRLIATFALLAIGSAGAAQAQASTPAQATEQQAAPTAPAQALGEEQVVAAFLEAAPKLFEDHLATRPDELKNMTLAHAMHAGYPECKGEAWYFDFLDCTDLERPTYSLDVKKTDSILTPYVGIIRVKTKEHCLHQSLVPSMWSVSEKALKKIAPKCLGKSFAVCKAAGAVELPKMLSGACNGYGKSEFPYDGEYTLTYRWSMRHWEFDRKEAVSAPPTAPVAK